MSSNGNLYNFECELVVGLVGAVGTNLPRITELLKWQFERAGYAVIVIKVSSDVIQKASGTTISTSDKAKRINELMTAGNEICRQHNDPAILAKGAAAEIFQKRQKASEDEKTPTLPLSKTVFIIDSLKRPEEVAALRQVYRMGFVLIGVHSEEERRLGNLTDQDISATEALELIRRDANEAADPFGQHVTNTFYLSDFFVHVGNNEDQLKCDLKRIVELLFGNPFCTPTFDEYAMYFAFAAALRSADLSRQVGAVITKNNQILATGANDCPKYGGGLYWPERNLNGCWEDLPNGRDHTRKGDTNRIEINKLINSICERAEARGMDRELLRDVLLEPSSPINDLTEYGRVVHAEMDALTSCARSNLSTVGATLYCTTFPCHNCTKHLIAAGISKVVFIEPYEKSKAKEFHQDSVVFGAEKHTVSNENQASKVIFEPFAGVGPRRFFDLFSMKLSSGYDVKRKEKDGSNFDWQIGKGRLRIQMLPSNYLQREIEATVEFSNALNVINKENPSI